MKEKRITLPKELVKAICESEGKVALICGKKISAERVAQALIAGNAGLDESLICDMSRHIVEPSEEEHERIFKAVEALSRKNNIVIVFMEDYAPAPAGKQ